ncbi:MULTISPECIES: hypothetical protein [Streptomyces]|uniref:hypothetical protein n=1 Tax=Streptomyces lycopersici TaxID=2974589 RepID=UPI0021D1F346|nr:hypothetical protein [Streptomyces sp. NEAU-383]
MPEIHRVAILDGYVADDSVFDEYVPDGYVLDGYEGAARRYADRTTHHHVGMHTRARKARPRGNA